ncbi:MAG TPA: DUF4126 family protein [Devosiaceae bacterium]|nr:DUF4126 family protein [Devosiaceae bacterium]
MFYVAVLVLGITAGLRAATPLAAVSWGAYLGWINLSGTWAAFAGNIITVIILSILAILELVGDQLPNTPSRKVPMQFGGRIVTGGLAGLVVGLPSGNWIIGLVLGVVGAVIGTLGGAEARKYMAAAFGRDLPAGLLEDLVAVVLAFLMVYAAGG